MRIRKTEKIEIEVDINAEKIRYMKQLLARAMKKGNKEENFRRKK